MVCPFSLLNGVETLSAKILNDPVAVIILAAGLGTRMKSNRAKVLHRLWKNISG